MARLRFADLSLCCALGALAGCTLPHASLRDPDVLAEPDRAELDAMDDSALVDDADSASDAMDAADGADATDAMDAMDAIDATDAMDAMDAIDVTDARDANDRDAADARADASESGADVACPAMTTRCGSTCENTQTSIFHCGGCGRACPTSPNGVASCEMGFCALRCNAGFRFSDPGSGPECNSDTTVAASACPGQALTVAADRAITVVGTTMARPASRAGTGACAMLTGPEAIYQITSPADGTLQVTLSSFEPLGVYALSGTCAAGAAGTQLACSFTPVADAPRGRVQSFTLEASAGQVFSLVVDSPMGAPQAYALTVEHASNCGLATDTSAAARRCGDENSVAGDGCSSTCAIEPNITGTACPMVATTPPGIRVADAPVLLEGSWMGGGGTGVCDSAHSRGERIYAVDVSAPTDLRIDLDPAVRSRTAVSVRRALTCAASVGEQCGNVAGDTATGERLDVSTTVANERIWVLVDSDTDGAYTLRITPRNCGDGALGPGEECDDGALVNGDGCDASCRVEAICSSAEGADTTLSNPFALESACRTARFTGTLNPTGGDTDDAVRIFLRAGESVAYQVASGAQGRCPMGLDPVLEVSRGTSAMLPGTRNSRCTNGQPALCFDDAATYCPEGAFSAPGDDWYTFRVYRFDDAGGLFSYQLLLTRR